MVQLEKWGQGIKKAMIDSAKLSRYCGRTGMHWLLPLCFMLQSYATTATTAQPVPTPKQLLGVEPGEWHLRHDQIEHYFTALAAARPAQTQLEVIGRTPEQRPLLQLIISSAENMAKLEQIRQQHLAVVAGTTEPDPSLPLIIWLGYGIHGNEPSAANAAVKFAQQLLSRDDAQTKQWLANSIILLQPSLNPDGHDRFAIWANMHQGKAPVADPAHREHVEGWPSGRPNHYWFDLNRDWLPLQQPESQARLQQFHRWQPQVLADFHEMGPNSSYFFQPGIPSRNHPQTAAENVRLTRLLAQSHAAAFDSQQKLYFTEEGFDDFYIGKGSTYPDLHGAVGILFEQASSRGHLQQTVNGPLSFASTIENQLLTSASTLRGAVAHKAQLQQWQAEFYRQSAKAAAADPIKGYLLTENEDRSRLQQLLQLLAQHQIKAYALTADVQQDGQLYPAGSSYFVPMQQRQYQLLKAAFSTQQQFQDNTFYDVSAWTLPYAYNIQFSSSRKTPTALSAEPWQPTVQQVKPALVGAYAYALRWTDQQAPLMLQQLLAKGVVVRSALQAFSAVTAAGIEQFAAGTMLIPAGLQQGDWFAALGQAQQQFALSLTAIQSGLTPMGQDLGSQQLVPVALPRVLLMAGPGVDSTEAGALWFSLEQLAGLSPSLVEPERFKRLDLAAYSHVLLPDGNYSSWQQAEWQALKQWVQAGGVLWAQKSALRLLAQQGILQAKVRLKAELEALIQPEEGRYAEKEQLAGRRRIAGAIFQTELDLSHPLTYGLPRPELAVFKNDVMLLQLPEQPFVTVSRYRQGQQLAGFVAPELAEQFSQSASLVAHNLGKGRVIAMTDDPVFRGYFQGSARLLINALYLGKAFDVSADQPGD